MGLGVLQILGGGLAGGFWLIFIGMFLRLAADAGYARLALRQSLASLRVRDVMSRAVVSVTPDTTLEQLAEQFWTHRFTSFPVVAGDTVLGIVHLDAMSRVARALGRDSGACDHTARGRLAVLDDDRLVGYVSIKDILHVLVLRGVPGQRAMRGLRDQRTAVNSSATSVVSPTFTVTS